LRRPEAASLVSSYNLRTTTHSHHDRADRDVVAMLQDASLIEQYVNQDGKPSMRLTPKGAQVGRALAMTGDDAAATSSVAAFTTTASTATRPSSSASCSVPMIDGGVGSIGDHAVGVDGVATHAGATDAHPMEGCPCPCSGARRSTSARHSRPRTPTLRIEPPTDPNSRPLSAR
jgi:hypothetical protein